MDDIQLPAGKLKKIGVAALYLFGSHAEGFDGDLSDIDVGVLLTDPRALKNSRQLYQELYDIFSDVFDLSGFKTIDIVFLQQAPLELRFDVITHGKVLFDQSPDMRSQFEDTTTMLSIDFKPLLDDFNTQILERV